MSTQAAAGLMNVESFLPEVSEPLSMLIGNASNRRYVFVYDSKVYSWNPGDIKKVEEHLGPPVDKWNQPTKIAKDEYEVLNNGKGKGGEKIVPRRLLVTRLGGKLDEILTKLFSQPGCPLYPVKKDGQDDQRHAIAENRYRTFRVPQCEQIIEDHRARCQRDHMAGLQPTPKPSQVREAEQDRDLFARTKKAGQGRYRVWKDGDSFDYLDDAQKHILKEWPEHETTWRSLVIDDIGGPNVFRADAPPAPLGPGTATEPPKGPSPAVLGVLRLADKAGKILDPDLVARIEHEPASMQEAFEIIATKQTKEEKARAAEWAEINEPQPAE